MNPKYCYLEFKFCCGWNLWALRSTSVWSKLTCRNCWAESVVVVSVGPPPPRYIWAADCRPGNETRLACLPAPVRSWYVYKIPNNQFFFNFYTFNCIIGFNSIILVWWGLDSIFARAVTRLGCYKLKENLITSLTVKSDFIKLNTDYFVKWIFCENE